MCYHFQHPSASPEAQPPFLSKTQKNTLKPQTPNAIRESIPHTHFNNLFCKRTPQLNSINSMTLNPQLHIPNHIKFTCPHNSEQNTLQLIVITLREKKSTARVINHHQLQSTGFITKFVLSFTTTNQFSASTCPRRATPVRPPRNDNMITF